MATHWYKFKVYFHGPGGSQDTYRHYPEGTSGEYIKDEINKWAEETSSDDGHYGYHITCEEVEAPPLDWLYNRIRGIRQGLILRYEWIRFLVEELHRFECSAEPELGPRRRQDAIPVLPKKEVPESGYRAIYDWVLTNVHPDLLLDGEKTISKVVIEILEKSVR